MSRPSSFAAYMQLFFSAVLLLLLVQAGGASAAGTKLVVYTALEPELLGKYAAAFTQKHPDIAIVWIRDSAGPVAARLLAEKDAPKADVVFGVALSALLPLEGQGVLDSYKALGTEHLAPGMFDSRENPVWVGTNGWGSALCVNTRVLEKKGLPMPKSWSDLTDPVYKGHIVAPSPVSSSTAYTDVSTWILTMGEEQAWEFMEKLHQNVTMYTHSGAKPAQMAAQGEFAVGISSPAFARPYIARKAPLAIVIPEEGTGWDLEAGALVKGGKNREAAQKLLDFSSSPEVAQLGVEYGYIPARRDAETPEIQKAREALLPMDPAKSAAMRGDVLAEWRKRFDSR